MVEVEAETIMTALTTLGQVAAVEVLEQELQGQEDLLPLADRAMPAAHLVVELTEIKVAVVEVLVQ